jgi:hypothetical protein
MKIFGRFQTNLQEYRAILPVQSLASTRGSDLDEDMGNCGDREVVFELLSEACF